MKLFLLHSLFLGCLILAAVCLGRHGAPRPTAPTKGFRFPRLADLTIAMVLAAALNRVLPVLYGLTLCTQTRVDPEIFQGSVFQVRLGEIGKRLAAGR